MEEDSHRRRPLVRLLSLVQPCSLLALAHSRLSPLLARRWTSKTGSGPAGDVDIHQYLGETLYKGAPIALSPLPALYQERG